MARTDRNGKRKSREHFRTRVPDLGYYFIVTDTAETEKNYLYGLRDSLPEELQGRLIIKVSSAKTEKLVQKCLEQAALEPQYAQPWIVFDRDQVARFDEIIAKAESQGVRAGWSNPCIEIWFDAYFGTMHNYQDSVTCCRGFANTWKKATGREYDKADPHIYETLNRCGNEEKAIRTAEQKMKTYADSGVSKPSEMCPGTTMQSLVSEIRLQIFNTIKRLEHVINN